jgi:hypothetical protein
MIDGLEVENFDITDFTNGSARIIHRASEAPAFQIGQLWVEQGSEALWFLHAHSNMSGALKWWEAHWMWCWTDTTFTAGMPCYIEEVYLGAIDGPPVPKANQYDGANWHPSIGTVVDNAPASSYVRVAVGGGMVDIYTEDGTVEAGRLAYIAINAARRYTVDATYDTSISSGFYMGHTIDTIAGGGPTTVRALLWQTGMNIDRA